MRQRKKILGILIVFLVLFTNSYVEIADAASSQNRIAGQNRFATAVAIASRGWTQSNYAILAYGYNYPDALAATPLAKRYDAPILLTEKDTLPLVTKLELSNLNTKRVFIVGGLGVISNGVENELKNMGIDVTRLAGQSRYDTSVKIAEQLENVSNVAVVRGDQYAGALSIASIAAKNNMPILLAQGDNLANSVTSYLSGKQITKTYVIGDFNDNVTKQLPNTEIISGSNIYNTNVKVLEKFNADYNFDNLFMATGEDFADALTGTAYAAKTSAPILLVNASLPLPSVQYLNSRKSVIKQLTILGGEGAVSASLVSDYLNSDSTNSVTGNYTPSEIAQKLNPSVVYIKTFDQNGDAIGEASGFICGENGKIGTNYHVIAGAYSAKVKLSTGEEYDVVNVSGYDQDNDIVMLKINASGLSPVTMGNSDNIANGDKVYAIGNPFGLEDTISDGLISSKNRAINDVNYIQISVPISPGSSGGILLNEQAQVIGITCAGLEEGQNINFAIPINTFKTILTSDLKMDLKTLNSDKMSVSDFINYLNSTYGKISVNNRTVSIQWENYEPETKNFDLYIVGKINTDDYVIWKNASAEDQDNLVNTFKKINKELAINFPSKSWFGSAAYVYYFGAKPSNVDSDELYYNGSNWEQIHVVAVFSRTDGATAPTVYLRS